MGEHKRKGNQHLMTTFEERLQSTFQDVTKADFHALRLAFANRPHYSGYASAAHQARLTSVNQALERQAWQDASQTCLLGLQDCFVSIRLHQMMAISLEKQGNEPMAQWHLFFASKLVNSILDSGDGTTPETAWKVISLEEEYAILHLKDRRPQGQALIHHHDTPYDRFDFADGSAPVFFNISAFFGNPLTS